MPATRVPRDDALRKRIRAVYARRQDPCGICGEPINYELKHPHPLSLVVDHVIPIAKGGPDVAANMVAAHRVCNRGKSDKLPGAWPAAAPDERPVPRTFVTTRNWKV